MRGGEGSAYPGQGSQRQAGDLDKRARDPRGWLGTSTSGPGISGPGIRRVGCRPRQAGQGSGGRLETSTSGPGIRRVGWGPRQAGQGSAGQGSEGLAMDHDKWARDQRARDQRASDQKGGPRIRRAGWGPRQAGQSGPHVATQFHPTSCADGVGAAMSHKAESSIAEVRGSPLRAVSSQHQTVLVASSSPASSRAIAECHQLLVLLMRYSTSSTYILLHLCDVWRTQVHTGRQVSPDLRSR